MAAFQSNGLLFSKGAALTELQALLDVYRAALLSHESYRTEGSIQAPIHLLKARERAGAAGFVDLHSAWGWQDCSERGAIVDDVPGSHFTMLASPQVETLAEKLQGVLALASTPSQVANISTLNGAFELMKR
jgi:thioesterase domain-containing protein